MTKQENLQTKRKIKYLIKRVIGLPGETIEYKEGKLKIKEYYRTGVRPPALDLPRKKEPI